MTTMIVTAQPNVEHQDDAQAYLSQAIPMLIEAGGKMIKRVKIAKPIVGERTFAASLVMEFPDTGSIESVFNSNAYAKIAPLREKGFEFMNIVVGEDM